MTKEILEQILFKLYQAGFIVVAIASGMGTGNVVLWSKLKVGYDKSCFFKYPCDELLKVFVIPVVPHLIKLIRNHLIDHSFIIENNIINSDYFEALLNISTSELTLAHLLTQHHLNVKGPARQRVRPAIQLLSNSVAKAIEYCEKNGMMPKNSHWQQASNMVKLFNDWFDMLNSHSKFIENCPGRNAFGIDLEKQTKLLNSMSEFIKSMRLGKQKELVPFQKRILQNVFLFKRKV